MGWKDEVRTDRDLEVVYRHFSPTRFVRIARTVAGVLTWPLVIPLALLSRTSDFIFRSASELVSLVPFVFGVLIRNEFYRWTLDECGRNVMIGFGTFFFYRRVRIGDNVAIGNYAVIQHCDIGSYALIGDGSQLLSGSKYHYCDRTDVPIALQGGRLRRIEIGDDCWIGVKTVVMASIGHGCIVGAGSVVTRELEPWSVAVGSPARVVKMRR